MPRYARLGSVLLPFLMAGCLGTVSLSETTYWVPSAAVSPSVTVISSVRPPARLANLMVRAPFDTKNFVVMRANGSVAFDPYNLFAAPPAAVFRGLAVDVLRESGTFEEVLPAGTSATTPLALEVSVDRLALDCREQGARTATATLSLSVLSHHEVTALVVGTGTADAASGNYASAFGEAFAAALRQAVSRLKE